MCHSNEWGPPLTGEEMTALKGRIDPETLVSHIYGVRRYRSFHYDGTGYHLPHGHPAYTPKPKESEVIRYITLGERLEEVGIREDVATAVREVGKVLQEAGLTGWSMGLVKMNDPGSCFMDKVFIPSTHPKSAVDVAAEDAWDDLRQEDMTTRALGIALFKEGAAWQKENGNG